MRKIVICMDGTGNDIGDGETNVLKLYKALRQDETQLAHYIVGVGADDGRHIAMRPLQKLQGVLGLAFGLGLEDDVLSAYRYLCRNFRDAEANATHFKDAHPRKKPPRVFEDDRIYIIGFSRGAYAARVLAGFIHNFGLVKQNVLHLIVPVFRAYRRINHREIEAREQGADKTADADVRFKALRQYENVLRPIHPPIRALGLFDTVASMIRFGWPLHNLRRHGSLLEIGTHANVSENVSVRIVNQALAIDERRTFFRALHWQAGGRFFGNNFRNPSAERIQRVRQRWFAGFHGDIGGSPREDEAGIGKITALWLLDALRQADVEADAEDNAIRAGKDEPLLPADAFGGPGLHLRRGYEKVYFRGEPHGNFSTKNPGGIDYCGPDPLAKIHNSVFGGGGGLRLSWFWLPLEVLIKSIKRREAGPPAWFRRGLLYYLPFLEPRRIPDSHEVDESVFVRRDNPACDYDPENLTRAGNS